MSEKSNDVVCPLCGQEAVKHHSYLPDSNEAVFRDDAKVCSQDKDGMYGREVWVHV